MEADRVTDPTLVSTVRGVIRLADTKPDMTPDAAGSAVQPARAGLVLISLIAVAAVANLNLSVANVALPSIGRAFDSSQTTLDLIAVGYSLAWLHRSFISVRSATAMAQADAHPRHGVVVPACLLAAYAHPMGCCSLLVY